MLNIIIRFKKSVVILFFVLMVISAVAFLFVDVNYNMQDYLPEDAESTVGLDVMDEEFSSGVTNTNVMIENVTIQEAIDYKQEIESLDGVTEVLWLDDVVDLREPIEVADTDTVENYYKNNKALLAVTIESGKEVEATDQIYELIGEENAISGEAANTATQQKMAGSETMYAAALLIPIIVIILVLSTNSWLEPVFFLTAIGVSVLINLGTNIFVGEVSFITQSVAPILQLAVSLDYAIFLLHSFQDYRNRGNRPEEAMKLAMKESFPVVSASALTTFFGFTALMFMDFGIGADLGLSLVKGILLSFISVMVFLPALTLLFYPLIDKTQHKSLIPSFKGVGKKLIKLRIPVFILIALVIVPSFLAQSSTEFTYGMGEQPENTRLGSDINQIEEIFGESTSVVLLVPNNDIGKEQEMIQEIDTIDHVTSVVGYANMVGSTIPQDYLEENVTEQFLSENYSRIIINTDVGAEGDVPFSLVEEVRNVASSYYGDEALTLGESVALYDMKETVTADNKLVNILTIVTIAIVLLFSFRSISIPVVLLLTIQSAVWINLSVPYFTDTSLVFVGYLIVSTVQLAATVDYAILLTETYKQNRKDMAALPAIKKTIDDKLFSIAVSASILSSVGFILWLTSSNPIVGSIGLLLGRGALLAFILVITLLPALLVIGDKLIWKTTLGTRVYKEEKHEDN
ncbi:MMPL family transporter [Oceanobacillus kimchii]|uniref:efflux RND transporter permease subunit n=1 Tax=Oceanobacillus kimchii TaxID=746691 RepID=UPI0021A2AE38|nr:MMPL family transporter [Oceanobacillus kimchii]MCT1577667.1 MMPL family transporter [Oceanobacillus kimchii]MCT2136655.1 MMPL family transporter [Oceanobacillus kimchii]